MMSSELIRKARDFAEERHIGQVRIDGTPYFGHLVRVSEIVSRFKESEDIDEIIAAALLHDILEDTDTVVDELKINFGETIALLVVELTTDESMSDLVGKANYLSDKFSCDKTTSDLALLIKLADRLDNVSDLNERDAQFARKMKCDTLVLLDALEKKRKITAVHKELIQVIYEKLEEVKV